MKITVNPYVCYSYHDKLVVTIKLDVEDVIKLCGKEITAEKIAKMLSENKFEWS